MLNAKVTRKELIKKYPEKLNKVNGEFLEAAGVMVQGAAKRNAAVSGDRLEGSILKEVGKDFVKIFTNLLYAVYVEYGTGIHTEGGKGRQKPWVFFYEKAGHFITTSGMKAQPYMRPAIDDNRKNLVKKW